MIDFLKRFLKEEEGLTTVEYAIAGSLVGLAVVSAFSQLGTDVGGAITDLSTVITTGAPIP